MSRRRTPLAGGAVLEYTDVTALTSAPTAATDGYELVRDGDEARGRRNAAPMMLEMRFVTPASESATIKVWYYQPEDAKWYYHKTLKVTASDELATRRVDCRRNATRVAIQVDASSTCHAAIDPINVIYDDGTVVLRDGTTDDWASIRNTATGGALTDNVVVIQHQDTAAAVPPAGDVNTNAPFTKLTDGTTDVAYKAADTATDTTTVVQPVQHVGIDGNALPSGDASDPVHINDDATATLISTLTAAKVRLTADERLYTSNLDFDAAYSSATDLDLTNMPFDPVIEDIIAVEQIISSGARNIFVPDDNIFSWTAGATGEGVLTVTDANFAAGDLGYVVWLRGPVRAYDTTTDTKQTTVVNQSWDQDSTTVLYDVTNGTDDTYNEYLDMDGAGAYVMYANLDDGSGTVTLSIAYSITDDGTAPESCDYVDMGLEEFGQATWTGAGDGEFLLQRKDGLKIKYLRVTIVANTSGANDGDWFVSVRKGV